MAKLTTAVPFEDYSDAVQVCNLDIDMDWLYEKYAMVEDSFSSPEMEGCHNEERYLKLFSKADSTYTERVFSMMTTAWRNERNRLDVSRLSCTEAYKKFIGNKARKDQ